MYFRAPVHLLSSIGNPFEWPRIDAVGLHGLRVPEFMLPVCVLHGFRVMRMTDSSRPTLGWGCQVMTEHGNVVGIVSAKLGVWKWSGVAPICLATHRASLTRRFPAQVGWGVLRAKTLPQPVLSGTTCFLGGAFARWRVFRNRACLYGGGYNPTALNGTHHKFALRRKPAFGMSAKGFKARIFRHRAFMRARPFAFFRVHSFASSFASQCLTDAPLSR
jgi:hypothetical protein